LGRLHSWAIHSWPLDLDLTVLFEKLSRDRPVFGCFGLISANGIARNGSARDRLARSIVATQAAKLSIFFMALSLCSDGERTHMDR